MNIIEQIKMGVRARHYRNHENPFEIAYILKNLNAGDCAMDIGANKGGFLYWMIKAVGNRGKVIAFEPQQFLFEFLSQFFSQKRYPQVFIEPNALSDRSENAVLIIPESGKRSAPGASIHFTTEDNPAARTEKVATISLDEYWEKNNVVPSLIKIDVEGHELKVVKGGLKTFAQYRPKILLECEAMQVGQELVRETLDCLIKIGYNGFFYFGNARVDIKDFNFSIHQPDIFSGKKRDVYVSNFFFE